VSRGDDYVLKTVATIARTIRISTSASASAELTDQVTIKRPGDVVAGPLFCFVAGSGLLFARNLVRHRVLEAPPSSGCEKRTHVMKFTLLATAAALATGCSACGRTTEDGQDRLHRHLQRPAAALGADMRNSFEIGLDHAAASSGGLPVEVTMRTIRSSLRSRAEDPEADRV